MFFIKAGITHEEKAGYKKHEDKEKLKLITNKVLTLSRTDKKNEA